MSVGRFCWKGGPVAAAPLTALATANHVPPPVCTRDGTCCQPEQGGACPPVYVVAAAERVCMVLAVDTVAGGAGATDAARVLLLRVGRGSPEAARLSQTAAAPRQGPASLHHCRRQRGQRPSGERTPHQDNRWGHLPLLFFPLSPSPRASQTPSPSRPATPHHSRATAVAVAPPNRRRANAPSPAHNLVTQSGTPHHHPRPGPGPFRRHPQAVAATATQSRQRRGCAPFGCRK